MTANEPLSGPGPAEGLRGSTGGKGQGEPLSGSTARPENLRWPFVAFRCPNRAEWELIHRAAEAVGESVSEFVRTAVVRRIESGR